MNDAVAIILQRVAQVEAWVALHPEALRPAALAPQAAEFPVEAELNAATEALCERRAELLRSATARLAQEPRGRALVCEYNLSICSGESEAVSGGFYDINDRPPWCLWLIAVGLASSGSPTAAGPSEAILAWVPEFWLPNAQAGIDANPYECIYWLSEAPAHVLHAFGGPTLARSLPGHAAA